MDFSYFYPISLSCTLPFPVKFLCQQVSLLISCLLFVCEQLLRVACTSMGERGYLLEHEQFLSGYATETNYTPQQAITVNTPQEGVGSYGAALTPMVKV